MIRLTKRVLILGAFVLWLLPTSGYGKNRLEAVQLLKNDLRSLLPPETATKKEVEQEVDLLALTIIQGFEEIHREFRMLRPPWLHNLFIHWRLREKGYCYHWTSAFYERLKPLPLRQFTLHWASARRGGFREHNTLVITSEGGDFENGILIDGWRKSGRPFWNFVGKDRYPWEEEPEALGLVF
ncbi:MAG: hypothetical protein HYS22_05520 [Deltaproteobacteria bacterium]|nr:hypothetical protein [Deltaproteobacteria bacterium]